MSAQSNIIAFPAASIRGGRVATSADAPEAGVAAPFREWLDPATLRAVVDDRPDAYEWLVSRAVPDDGDTFLDFRFSDFLRIVSDDPATGGVIGISIMVGVVAVIGALVACGGWSL